MRQATHAIEKTVDSLGLDCDFERTGSIAVAVEPYQAAELAAAPTRSNRSP